MGRIVNADGEEVIQAVFLPISRKCGESREKLNGETDRESVPPVANCTAYPLIMRINLTQDYYSVFMEEQDSYTIDRSGSYDELFRYGARKSLFAYREDYSSLFSRKR